MKICAKAAVSVPLHEFPVILSITFKFFSAGNVLARKLIYIIALVELVVAITIFHVHRQEQY